MSTIAEKRVGHMIPTKTVVASENKPATAISVRLPFAEVSKHADMSVPLRRPRKVSPSIGDHELKDELDAWDAASDEALRAVVDTDAE